MPEYYETTDDYRIKYGHCFALATDLDEKYASVVQFQDHFNKGSGNIRSLRLTSQCSIVL